MCFAAGNLDLPRDHVKLNRVLYDGGEGGISDHAVWFMLPGGFGHRVLGALVLPTTESESVSSAAAWLSR